MANTHELELQIGSRGHTYIKSHNRGLVRQWLVSRGLPAKLVNIQPNWVLGKVYNDENAYSEFVAGKFGRKVGDAETTFPKDAENYHLETETTSAHSVATETTVKTEEVNKLAELLAGIASKGGVDQEAVERITRATIETKWAELPDMIAKYSPLTTIEVKQHDGNTSKVEGHSHPKLATLIKAMSARQSNGRHPNIMIVGPTGSGKTHGVEQAAKALGLEFYSNGAISMDHQLVGFKDANGNYHETALRKAFGKPAVYLFDEIDSSDNSPLLCLAGALANGGFDFPDAFVERHPDSVIIACANTWGNGATSDFVGRNKLDGAIRSRFPVRIAWDYDEALERQISGNIDWACRVQKARANARRAGLKVIIDPRMSQAGAALIASGLSSDEAAQLTYLADLSDDQRRIVEEN